MRITFISVAALALAGCATTAGYDKRLSSLVGSPEIEVLRQFGAPQNVYESAGKKFLTYSSSRIISIPGMAPNYNITMAGNTAYTSSIGSVGSMTGTKSCQTTFEIDNGIVTRYQFKGNDCKAK